MTRLSRAAAILDALVMLIALPGSLRVLTSSADEDEGYYDRDGNWVHYAPELGIEVIEAVDGFTANGTVDLDFGATTITLPQAKGITWLTGDTPYGYGLVVMLPHGTRIFFGGEWKMYIDYSGSDGSSDGALLAEIVSQAGRFTVVNDIDDLPNRDEGTY